MKAAEAEIFISILQRLSEDKQKAVYFMVKGAALISKRLKPSEKGGKNEKN